VSGQRVVEPFGGNQVVDRIMGCDGVRVEMGGGFWHAGCMNTPGGAPLSLRKAVDTLILLAFSVLFDIAVIVLNRRKHA